MAYIAGFQEQVSQENKTETYNIFRIMWHHFWHALQLVITKSHVQELGVYGSNVLLRGCQDHMITRYGVGESSLVSLENIISHRASGDMPNNEIKLTTLSHRLRHLQESHGQ